MVDYFSVFKLADYRQIIFVTNDDDWVDKPLTRLKRCAKEAGIEDKLIKSYHVKMGEHNKTMQSVTGLLSYMLDESCERKSLLIALGGGVVGDMVGFAAAIYLRGVDFLQIPTSLLAQVDSSVGGKTGVNMPQGKNLIGAFNQPKGVCLDVAFLQTLPLKEIQTGFAEIVKYGVIYDAKLFAYLETWFETHSISDYNDYPQNFWQHIIMRSCEIKAEVVSADEKEKGLRAILNYGHTLGHAIENLEGYGVYNHGEAVSIGMVFAANLAVSLNLWRRQDAERQLALLKKIGLPVEYKLADLDGLMSAMSKDKKVEAGDIKFVLPVKIGEVIVKVVERDAIAGQLEQ
jgi:3-dehydroquinate synthase